MYDWHKGYMIEAVKEVIRYLYSIESNLHGKGYGTETLKTILDYLKNEKGFYMVCSNCSSENPASRRIMEKTDMNLDAILKNRLKARFNENRADIYCFSY